jgi:energy-converting hydrogenase A subunit M
MRTDAWKKCNDIIESGKKFDSQKFFNDVFMPIAENLEVEVDKFN